MVERNCTCLVAKTVRYIDSLCRMSHAISHNHKEFATRNTDFNMIMKSIFNPLVLWLFCFFIEFAVSSFLFLRIFIARTYRYFLFFIIICEFLSFTMIATIFIGLLVDSIKMKSLFHVIKLIEFYSSRNKEQLINVKKRII